MEWQHSEHSVGVLQLVCDPRNPVNFVREALAAVHGPKWASPFGRAMGFVINYREDYAVRFDLAGNPVACSEQPLRAGQTRLTIKGKSLSGILQAQPRDSG